jgi:Phosphoglycerol transferase and related proteins, alkaline phosphatase superfamily
MDLAINNSMFHKITHDYNNHSGVNSSAGILVIFLLLNTLKITWFNMSLAGSDTLQAFLYKAGITLLLETIIFSIILGMKSRLNFILFYTLQTAYILINLVYYMYFHSYLHFFQAFALASESTGAARDLSVLLTPKLFIVLLDFPAAICIIWMYKRISTIFVRKYHTKKMSLIICCLLVITSVEGWNYIHHYSIFNIAKPNDSTSESLIVRRYGTIANNLTDMALNKNTDSLINQFKYGNPVTSKGTASAKPNFAIIQVESMDANAVNKQHDGKYIMPFLHSLSQQSVYYPYTLSYHEAGGTSDSEFSTMNSVEPLGDYPAMEISSYNYPNSIIRQLSDNSYTTLAFHGDVGSYYDRNISYPKMGYRKLYDLTGMGLSEVGWGAPDSDVFNYAEKTLKNTTQPFFAYTITMTSHGPFTNANNYYNNTNYNDIKDQTSRDYMNSMSYVDQSIRDYVNYIRANYPNTYIIIWGDHTPDINTGDYKQASFTDADRYFEFVPLIISTPDNTVYKEDKIAASFLDIAPTIANASGIPYNINSDGLDLLNKNGKSSPIPYRGGMFDRNDLYNKISIIK